MKKSRRFLDFLMIVFVVFSITACATTEKMTYLPEEFDVKDLYGYYVSEKFFDSLNETKSVKEATQYGWVIFIKENIQLNSDGDMAHNAMMVGDMRQGGPVFVLSESEFDEEKTEHILTYSNCEPSEHVGDELVLTYYPLSCGYHIKGDLYCDLLINKNERVTISLDDDLRRIEESLDVSDVVAYELLKDSPDVSLVDGRVLIVVDGKEYRLRIPGFEGAGFEGESRMYERGALGLAFLMDGEEIGETLYYFVEDGNMILKDVDGNVVVTIEM